SSLEDRSTPVSFPAPDHLTTDGYRAWLTTVNDLGLKHKMTALGSQNHVVMIDPASFIDIISPGHENIHAILFGMKEKQVITSSEPLDPVVWEQIKHLDGQTLTVDNTVYRLHRIPELGLAIATWSSTLPLQEKFRHQLVLWLPLGLFISLLT
ncbi:EAL domain-containing protein, partial [Escherichia coli]|nr:EAL domain-containing protein [Escherichia coli]